MTICILYPIIFHLLLAVWKTYSRWLREKAISRRSFFLAFASIAAKAYSDENEQAVIQIDNDYTLRLINSGDDRKLWLWECSETNKRIYYVVAIRGSHTVNDWATVNRNLVLELAGNEGDVFSNTVDQYFRSALHLLNRNQIRRGAEILWVGHSLGASIAESCFAKCLNDNGFKRLELIGKGAVTFDSPGQPERYRTVGNGFTPQMKKMVTTMNNRPNLVNTLTKPIASEFYCCGRGS